MKDKQALENIFISQDNQDIRAKIKSLIGYDIPSIIDAWANHLGYENLQNKDITQLLLKANILDDEFSKFLQSLQAIKSTTNRLSKNDFISLFKTLISNAGSMDSALPYIEDIINYLGYALYIVMLSGLDVKPFSFMLLKAKHQQATYKNPWSPQAEAESINQLEYTAHARIKSLKVKQTIKPQTAPAQQKTASQQTEPQKTAPQPAQQQPAKQQIEWPPGAQFWWDGHPAKSDGPYLSIWNGKEWVPG